MFPDSRSLAADMAGFDAHVLGGFLTYQVARS
jgi:hypothetical protein